MGKKGGGGAASSKHKTKKPLQKAKKSGQFKALKKVETRQGFVLTEKKAGAVHQNVSAKPKQGAHRVPDEFRNFDERMAATRLKKQAARPAPAPSNLIVSAPSFVMAAPTFQFNAPAVAKQPPREVEGFDGFLSAMQEPATAPPSSAPREARRQPRASAPNNVFAVLDDEPEPPMQPEAPAPSFLLPATFTFQSNGAASTSSAHKLTSLQRSLVGSSATLSGPAGVQVGLDPDL